MLVCKYHSWHLTFFLYKISCTGISWILSVNYGPLNFIQFAAWSTENIKKESIELLAL